MIEISLDELNSMLVDMNDMTDEEINEKYNLDINELEENISDHIDQCYINNNIYHIFPILSISMLALNTILFVYFV